MRAEKRRHPRAPILATAVLHRQGEPISSHRVMNASAGGVLLEGQAPPVIGRVEVLLRLPGDRSVRGEAVVVRNAPSRDGGVFALSFVRLSADDEDAIQDAVLAVLEESRTASVLIVDRNVEVSHALREAMVGLGHRAFAVGTVLEAVHALEQPNSFAVAFVDVILADGAFGLAAGREVLGYLADRHPGVRRVLMAGDVYPWQLELARNAVSPYTVHEVLPKPWTDSALIGALGG